MKNGFTIIETILALSVSSLIAVGMIIGWNTNIERQRYQDAILTFQSDIQNIFKDVENPAHSESLSGCVSNFRSGVIISPTTPDSASRGASNCILVGKMIVFGESEVDARGFTHAHWGYSVVDIIGRDVDLLRDCTGGCRTHVDALKASNVSFDSANIKSSRLQWDYTYTNITDNNGGRLFRRVVSYTGSHSSNSGAIMSLAIVRSPLDGTLLVFANPNTAALNLSTQASRNSLFDQGLIVNDNRKIDLCIRKWRSSIFERNRVIRIGHNANSVEVAPLDGDHGLSCGNGEGASDVRAGGSVRR